jgi:hypothetical protein
VHAGVDFYRLGEHVHLQYNAGDKTQVVGNVGVSGTF